MRKINKIIDDTLKAPNGKWSRKSLTILVTFAFVLLLGTFITISDKILEREVNKYSIEVFNSLLLFLTALMGILEVSKKVVNKQAPVNEE